MDINVDGLCNCNWWLANWALALCLNGFGVDSGVDCMSRSADGAVRNGAVVVDLDDWRCRSHNRSMVHNRGRWLADWAVAIMLGLRSMASGAAEVGLLVHGSNHSSLPTFVSLKLVVQVSCLNVALVSSHSSS